MPAPRINEIIQCRFAEWKLTIRRGVYYADGRSNQFKAGRPSLGTKNEQEAIENLHKLDHICAENTGLIPRDPNRNHAMELLSLQTGRELYENHNKRPQVTGGVRESTQKRYRTVFDKFIPFANDLGFSYWNGVSADVLNRYAMHLEEKSYHQKTILNELVTLKQCIKWLISSKHLNGVDPIDLKLKKVESQSAYCYRPEEVSAMINKCFEAPELFWLGNILVCLACTGMRISELAALRWSDVDLENGTIHLKDESSQSKNSKAEHRQLKSGKSRSFPIHHQLLVVLKTMDQSGAYVFCGPRGGRVKPDTIRRIMVRDVINPLKDQFPSHDDEQGFKDGRLHSFRHYFCSTCANSAKTSERVIMNWLGHADSEMIKYYYHLHDEESRRQMEQLDFLGNSSGCSVENEEEEPLDEDVDPTRPEEESD